MAKKTKAPKGPMKGRRYIGTAETVGYIMFDAADKVRVGPNGEWTDRILNISKRMQALTTPITSTWDIVNDVFVAAFIDRTRTRWGKFKPWLVMYSLYGFPFTLLTFALPYMFWQTDSEFLPKILVSAGLGMFNELTGTIFQTARMGMCANITPNPDERIALITKAKFMSFGSSLPGQIFKILRDVISRSTSNTALQVNANLRSLFTIMGVGTFLITAAMSLYYAIVTRERVFDSKAMENKPPTIKESLIALKNNRPLLLFILSQVLDGINIGGQKGLYVDSILNFSNFGTVYGIPGGFISTPSYFWVPALRQRFSTKALWIASENITKPIQVGIYFFGMIKTKKAAPGNGFKRMYAHLWPMIFAYMIDDMVAMTLYGTKRVIPEEIRNEMIDYGEWKNGFRGEAMVGMMRGLPGKIAGAFGNTLTNTVLAFIGFQTGENYLKQTQKTADSIFALATIIPALTGCIGLIPKFFYNIDQKTRTVMYADLAERRAAAMDAMFAVAKEMESEAEIA